MNNKVLTPSDEIEFYSSKINKPNKTKPNKLYLTKSSISAKSSPTDVVIDVLWSVTLVALRIRVFTIWPVAGGVRPGSATI